MAYKDPRDLCRAHIPPSPPLWSWFPPLFQAQRFYSIHSGLFAHTCESSFSFPPNLPSAWMTFLKYIHGYLTHCLWDCRLCPNTAFSMRLIFTPYLKLHLFNYQGLWSFAFFTFSFSHDTCHQLASRFFLIYCQSLSVRMYVLWEIFPVLFTAFSSAPKKCLACIYWIN